MNLSLFSLQFILRGVLMVVVLSTSLAQAKAQIFKWALQQPFANMLSGTAAPLAVTDLEGNVYMTGQFYGSQDFDPGPGTSMLAPLKNDLMGVYISKFDAEGKHFWTKSVMSGSFISVMGVAVDRQDNVIVTGGGFGYYQTKAGIDSTKATSAVFIAKYDSKGDFLWFKTVDAFGADSLRPDLGVGSGVRTDVAGNIYIGGNFNGSYNFDSDAGSAHTISGVSSAYNGYVCKYDADGKCIWVKAIVEDASTQPPYSASVYGIAVDTLQNVYMTGHFMGSMDFDPGPGKSSITSAGLYDVFILKLDKLGQYKWSKRMGGTSLEMPSGISLGGLGSIFISGVFRSFDADFDPGPDTAILYNSGSSITNLFFARYDAEGNYRWAKSISGNGVNAIPSVIMADDQDNLYLPGLFMGGALDLDPGPDTAFVRQTNASFSSRLGFLAKYDDCGNFMNGFQVGSEVDFDYMGFYSVFVRRAADGSIDAYAAGEFSAPTDFDWGPGSSVVRPNEMTDAFLLKINYPEDAMDTVYVSACGEKYEINGNTYTESGGYLQVIPLNKSCDSVFMLQLSISSVSEPIINVNGFVLGVSESNDRYQWLKNGAVIVGATDSTYNVQENAEYQVIVYNENGCSDTSDVYTVTNVSINSHVTKSTIHIYPNPASEMVFIQSDRRVQVQLTDMGGRKIMEQWSMQPLSIKSLAPGMYMMYIKDAQGSLLKVQKLVKTDQM